MIDLRKASAGGFGAGVLIMCVLALSVPASARGGGGGGGGGGSSHSSRGPGRPPPPVFLDSSTTGRAIGSDCTVPRKPVTRTSGGTVGYHRAQGCN
jgi:hypothetical protein